MEPMTFTQTLPSDTPCPVCARKTFDLRPSDEPGQARSRYVATCTACGHPFEVERTGPEPAAGRPCERCPDGALEPVLRRKAGSGRFEVAWICRHCEGAGASLLMA